MQSCSFTKLLEVQADLKKVIENIVSKSGETLWRSKETDVLGAFTMRYKVQCAGRRKTSKFI
jgi:shikimate kinase